MTEDLAEKSPDTDSDSDNDKGEDRKRIAQGLAKMSKVIKQVTQNYIEGDFN